MKRVRSMAGKTLSNPAPLVKRKVVSTASLTNRNRAGLAAKHPLSNVASFFTRVRNLDDLVHDLLVLTEPEFKGKLFVFPANSQLQLIARLLLLEPALHAPGHLAAVPVEDDVPGTQAGLSRRGSGIDRAHDERTARLVLHGETKRQFPALHGSQTQAC